VTADLRDQLQQTLGSAYSLEQELGGGRMGRVFSATELPFIHEQLGALYESRGDPRNASAHYHALIKLWKNSDAELQPRVEKARAAVRRLADLEPPSRP